MRSLDPAESAFCDRALNEVSRTFALSIRCLPSGLRDAVRAAYLLCRIVDTIEDDRALPAAARSLLFDAFDCALRTEGEPDAAATALEAHAAATGLGKDWERTLATHATIVFRAFASLPDAQRRVITPRILEMSRGMREYSHRADGAGGLRIQDLPDLERYCHYVAGTVGELLTGLFLLSCPMGHDVQRALEARAARFGLGLQLVNILKDVTEDAERGDCLLPAECAADHGVRLDRLFDRAARPRALGLCRFLSGRAREHLEAAEEYTLLWPCDAAGRDARVFCAGPLALALGTLREIEVGADTLVVGRAPTVSRDFVLGVFGELERATASPDQATSDLALRALFNRARVGIAGRPSRPPAPPLLPSEARRPGPLGALARRQATPTLRASLDGERV